MPDNLKELDAEVRRRIGAGEHSPQWKAFSKGVDYGLWYSVQVYVVMVSVWTVLSLIYIFVRCMWWPF